MRISDWSSDVCSSDLGGPVSLREDKIVIARTAASIDAIPASHSVGVEARDKVGGRLSLDYLVREGDQLPKRSEEHTSELQSLMRISYAVFCLKKKTTKKTITTHKKSTKEKNDEPKYKYEVK